MVGTRVTARGVPAVAGGLRSARKRRAERAVRAALLACAVATVLVTAGIVVALFADAAAFFADVGLGDYLTSSEWAPQSGSFGVRELLYGTAIVTVGALSFAVPLGVATAVYLSEYASERVRRVVKPALELLAGIPTVVFGYFALDFVTPNVLRRMWADCGIFNWASASIVVGLFVLPIVASLSEDALRAVPRSLRDAAYGLGASKLRVATRVVLPAALSGVTAAAMLAMSRSVGETMAVTIAAGATPQMALSPCSSVQTMTAYVVQVAGGEASAGSIEYGSMFALGATLFLVTLALNHAGVRFVARFREAY